MRSSFAHVAARWSHAGWTGVVAASCPRSFQAIPSGRWSDVAAKSCVARVCATSRCGRHPRERVGSWGGNGGPKVGDSLERNPR